MAVEVLYARKTARRFVRLRRNQPRLLSRALESAWQPVLSLRNVPIPPLPRPRRTWAQTDCASISKTGAAWRCRRRGHPWGVRLSESTPATSCSELKAGRINSAKLDFIRFRLEIWQNGESLLAHEYSARDCEVLIQFPVGTLGDPMGSFPYAVKFQERHGCRLTCALVDRLIPLYRDAYPGITQETGFSTTRIA
jgi:hypothetical protein